MPDMLFEQTKNLHLFISTYLWTHILKNSFKIVFDRYKVPAMFMYTYV